MKNFISEDDIEQRQQIQRGRYILFHNELSEAYGEVPPSFLSRIKPMSKDDDCIIGRITIQGENKQAILEEMKILGIDRGMLFADSVDILCDEKKRIFFIGSANNLMIKVFYKLRDFVLLLIWRRE